MSALGKLRSFAEARVDAGTHEVIVGGLTYDDAREAVALIDRLTAERDELRRDLSEQHRDMVDNLSHAMDERDQAREALAAEREDRRVEITAFQDRFEALMERVAP